MAKRKKHILALEEQFEFDIIGLCSHHNDYRLAWSINEKTGLKLSKCAEDYVQIDRKGNMISTHSMFTYEDESNRLTYYLVKNKEKGKYLISEKPTIDYFLFLYDNHAIEMETLVSKLKSVNSVLAAYLFQPEEMSSVENLAFE